MNGYEHLTNLRLAEKLEQVKEDNIEHLTVDEILMLEEAARRLKQPLFKPIEDYMGEC